MTQTIHTHQFDNGLILIAEPMMWLESAAFSMLLPVGCACDPPGKVGLNNLLCDMVQRGCGSRDSRQFVEDLENLGVASGESVSISHTSYGGAMQSDKLYDALSIYADLVRRPLLPEDQIEEGRQVCFQEIRAAEDDLSQKVMTELRRRCYGDPYGRNAHGTLESVQQLTIDDVRSQFERAYQPQGAIFSVAGKIDWEKLKDQVGQLFGDWRSGSQPSVEETPPEGGYRHIDHESQQTHIGVGYPSAAYRDDDYFQARGAVGVLSDGMSSRLFTEVREKRGLCYTVSASCHSLYDRGSVICYAGTTTERAQETLDVMTAELHRLAEGIETDELDRLKARIKSALIMQQESSSSRSSSLAAEWYLLGRARTLDELGRIIDNLSCESINDYLAAHPPGDFTIVTLGEKKLETPVEIS